MVAFRGCLEFAGWYLTELGRNPESEISGKQVVRSRSCPHPFQRAALGINQQESPVMLRVDWRKCQELGGRCCAQLCALLPQLVSVLREVSYLCGSGAGAIPLAAAEIYSCKESFRQLVASLELMGNRYNKVLRTVLEVEYPLVQGQLRDIDLKLKEAEETLTWKMEGELALCDAGSPHIPPGLCSLVPSGSSQ